MRPTGKDALVIALAVVAILALVYFAWPAISG
jgi:hypothetical protein